VTELALDAVVAGEGGLELLEEIRSQWHSRSRDQWERYPGAGGKRVQLTLAPVGLRVEGTSRDQDRA
jgi:hypothetical protein